MIGASCSLVFKACSRFLRAFLMLVLAILTICSASANPAPRSVHVFVALADNQYQGIIPVAPKLGNGDVAAANLYWGAAFGVKSFFRASSDWRLIFCSSAESSAVLERCVFKHRSADAYIIADAYRGREIRSCVTDFLAAAAGVHLASAQIKDGDRQETVGTGGNADLVVYVGHDPFMDFQIPAITGAKSAKHPAAIILACASKPYFGPYLKSAEAAPLLWTTGLMAPEAYSLKAALVGWLLNEGGEAIRQRAATAYDRYQHCGIRGAQRLFATGW